MAKFGQLYLNNGVWEGEQIIPAEWVARSSETYLSHWVGGYGYQWWTFPQSGIYYASGAYEQRIYVIPDLDMVVVFTADNKASELEEGEMRSGPPMVDWLLGRFILPSCKEYAHSAYAKYGFSVEVPGVIAATELGKSLEGPASEESGMVQFRYGASPYEIIGVQWDTVEGPPDLQVVLDDFAAVVESFGAEVNKVDQPVSGMKDDHELIYQRFEVNERGYAYPGVIGAWYCDDTRRVYLLYYATVPELAKRTDTLTEFQRTLNTFVCH
jgi:hypothetical protein